MPRGSPAKSPPAPTPRHGKRARTREALLDATMRVLARGGTGPVSIQEVTAEAGLANGTFYNYFRTREELLEATVVPLTQRLVQRLNATSAGVGIDDPARRLALGVRGFIDHAIADRTWAAALVRLWGSTASLPRRAGVIVLADLRAAQKRRRLRVPDEGAALDLVQGTVIASIRSVIEGKATAERGIAVAALLLRALGLPAREAEALANSEMPPLAPESAALR
ncbi:MAG: TetR/AcrR family transcriptional regulator [Myxococcota bacterium]